MKIRCMGCMEEFDDQFDVCPHCGYVKGTPAKEAYHMEPGSVLKNRYIVGRVLGFGGFGVTYIGYDPVLESKVAIKEYLPGEFSTRMPKQMQITVYSGDREEQFNAGKEKVIDEARRLASLKNAPNVVRVFDSFEENNTAYIVMEYCDGESIKEILSREGKLPVDRALDIVLQVISGMKEVHKSGLIHRDIAPDNLYIMKDGSVRILDFGAARYASTKHSKSLSVIIKPGYAPEEQYRSRGDQGPWTDVYALAATFYKMITGKTPDDAMERSIKDMLQKPSKLGVEIPKPLETALMNALNIRIEDRTASMEEFEEELLAAEVAEKVAHKRKSDAGKIPLPVKIGAGVFGAAVAGLAIFLMLHRTGPQEAVLSRNQTTVPNFVNLSGDETIRAKGEEYEVDPYYAVADFSDLIPEGAVTAQDQNAGTVVDKGERIGLTRSLGRRRAVVPQLLGRFEEEAKLALEEAGLHFKIEEISDPESAPFTVKTQSIAANTEDIARGSTVVLQVVKDEGQDVVAENAPEIEIPDFLGLTEQEAEEKNRSGDGRMFLLSVSHAYSDTVEKGRIMELRAGNEDGEVILPGAVLKQGSRLTIVISDGIEQVMVPQGIIINMGGDEAGKTLEELGFRVNVVTSASYNSQIAAGKVQELSLEEGKQYDRGSEITVTLSRGERPAESAGTQQPAAVQQPQQTAAPAQTQAPVQTQPAQTAPPETAAPTPPPTQAPATQAPQPADTGAGDKWDNI